MTAKLKKYLLPNIPYLFALWFFLKLGTAYRMAGGLLGMVGTIGAAFGTLAPSPVGFDWLVGVSGAALLRAVVYFKVKKARNSERMWNTARRVGERTRT